MPVEEDSAGTVTRNFVGARGIEAIATTQNSVTNTAYPLYDTHGNMTATLSLTGNGTGWNIANERSYDVWGGVRSGAATGGPKGRYVANLGHVQDDESGLIYMRARYYEPESGRFVSEDFVGSGSNWYAYCGNDPVNFADPTGGERETIEIGGLIFDLDKGMHGWDLHVSDSSGEIWSRFANGGTKHQVANEKLGKILSAVADAVKSGNKSQLAFLKKIFRAGGFGLGDDFAKMMSGVIGGFAIFAVSSLDAYFQIDPVDFMDTMLIISSGGQYGL